MSTPTDLLAAAGRIAAWTSLVFGIACVLGCVAALVDHVLAYWLEGRPFRTTKELAENNAGSLREQQARETQP